MAAIGQAREDAALWAAAATDPRAFGELYERHARSVFAFCARQTGDLALAEDLTSIVFLHAWRKRRSIEIDCGSALPWLLGTARNVVRNQRRSTWRHRAALSRLAAGAARAESGLEDDSLARLDAQRRLRDALEPIARLPPRQREALSLVVWSGLSYEQAARALDVPIGTVRSRVARARAALGAISPVSDVASREESP
ncbi:MAG: RNA polymerase sigma factor [Solirubrobacteraceae bacterium]